MKRYIEKDNPSNCYLPGDNELILDPWACLEPLSTPSVRIHKLMSAKSLLPQIKRG